MGMFWVNARRLRSDVRGFPRVWPGARTCMGSARCIVHCFAAAGLSHRSSLFSGLRSTRSGCVPAGNGVGVCYLGQPHACS